MFFPSETFRTSRANVWLISCMAFHMPLQRRRVRKNVKTNRTGEHASTQMAFPVAAQLRRTSECFPADLQNKKIMQKLTGQIKKLSYLTSKRFPFGMIPPMDD